MFSDPSKLLRAARFASIKHRDQRRKDTAGSPYVNHVIDVATTLAEQGGVTDVVLLVAALLHDTVEDTETSFADLAARFGEEVCAIVAEVTDDKSLSRQRRKQLQVETARDKSLRAKQLKVADKICNVRDIDQDSPEYWDLARKIQYVEWADAVVQGCRGANPRLDALFDQTVRAARDRLAPKT